MLIEPWFWRPVIFRESSKFDVRVWGYDYVWSGLCCWNHGLMSVWCCVIFAFQVSIQHPCIIMGLLASYRLSSFSLVLCFFGSITVTLISMFLECPTTYGYGKSHCVVKEIIVGHWGQFRGCHHKEGADCWFSWAGLIPNQQWLIKALFLLLKLFRLSPFWDMATSA